MPGTIPGSKEEEEDKRGKAPALPELILQSRKIDISTDTVKHRADSKKCPEGNPLTRNELGGSNT